MLARSRRESNRFARTLFDGLPARYDALAELLSFGQNRRWRAAMVDRVTIGLVANWPRADGTPPMVLDVATGTAGVALALERRTAARVVGVDLTEAMLRKGVDRVESERQSRARRAGPEGRAAGRPAPLVAMAVGRGEQLPFPEASFDALTFTYLLRYVEDPAATLRELARVVRPGGVVASLEFHVPEQPGWRRLWWLYTRSVLPLAGWLLGGRPWLDVGRFLGPSISAHYRRFPDAWTVSAWEGAGMAEVGMRTMSLGGGVVTWATRAGSSSRRRP